LPAFILLYATLYAAFGVASPFWPRFFEARGVSASELGVLLGLGIVPRLIDRLGPSGAAAIATTAGIVRWMVMSQTTAIAALAFVQPLHGCTFALLHLACMRLIATSVPARLAATGQAIFAFGVGGATALMIFTSGALYARFGAHAFLLMALSCALALPLTTRLRTP
jgi:MFS transporter, PPP family, 3-phenylpropionic acid transporter